jgi:Sortase and related acyltransferases
LEYSVDNIVIKKAEPKDVPLILSLIKEIAEYEKLSHEVVATEEILAESLFGKNANTEVVIAYDNDIVAGYAVFFHNFSTFIGKSGLYLEDIYIKPEMRAKGIGKKIFKYLVNLAAERNCGRMEWAVLNWNVPAINFYQKLGAVPLEGWTVYRLTEDKLTKLTIEE